MRGRVSPPGEGLGVEGMPGSRQIRKQINAKSGSKKPPNPEVKYSQIRKYAFCALYLLLLFKVL